MPPQAGLRVREFATNSTTIFSSPKGEASKVSGGIRFQDRCQGPTFRQNEGNGNTEAVCGHEGFDKVVESRFGLGSTSTRCNGREGARCSCIGICMVGAATGFPCSFFPEHGLLAGHCK